MTLRVSLLAGLAILGMGCAGAKVLPVNYPDSASSYLRCHPDLLEEPSDWRWNQAVCRQRLTPWISWHNLAMECACQDQCAAVNP